MPVGRPSGADSSRDPPPLLPHRLDNPGPRALDRRWPGPVPVRVSPRCRWAGAHSDPRDRDGAHTRASSCAPSSHNTPRPLVTAAQGRQRRHRRERAPLDGGPSASVGKGLFDTLRERPECRRRSRVPARSADAPPGRGHSRLERYPARIRRRGPGRMEVGAAAESVSAQAIGSDPTLQGRG